MIDEDSVVDEGLKSLVVTTGTEKAFKSESATDSKLVPSKEFLEAVDVSFQMEDGPLKESLPSVSMTTPVTS